DTFLKGIHTLTGSLPPRGSPALVPPVDGPAARSLDDIATAARAVMPGARLAVLRIPAQKNQAWAATFHRKGDSGESTDSGPTAFIDPYALKILRVDDPAAMPFGARIVKWMEPIHYGKFGGTPVKILWAFLGLMPLMFATSGALMWWNRTGGLKRRRKARAA
ncbi:MAG: PepSY-associated TM helix domain-containing protein, partial [Vicinamibacteria bacterium]